MQLGLEGKVAVVTGASSGIGLAATRALTGEGVHVVAGARKSSPELEALVRAGSVQSVSVDLRHPRVPPTSPRSRSSTAGSTSSSTTLARRSLV